MVGTDAARHFELLQRKPEGLRVALVQEPHARQRQPKPGNAAVEGHLSALAGGAAILAHGPEVVGGQRRAPRSNRCHAVHSAVLDSIRQSLRHVGIRGEDDAACVQQLRSACGRGVQQRVKLEARDVVVAEHVRVVVRHSERQPRAPSKREAGENEEVPSWIAVRISGPSVLDCEEGEGGTNSDQGGLQLDDEPAELGVPVVHRE
mmetsp:Transcript_84548/g.244253  ORF Transcript_84548/g.244253 Transcript_84548/m.244253 type:complete len:205 (+) Transcript_84548:246-860(+)